MPIYYKPFPCKSRKQVKPKEDRIRLIKILFQQSWSHSYCILSTTRACFPGQGSFHRNCFTLLKCFSQSLVSMIQLREMAYSSSLPSNLQHLGLQIRSLTLGNNLPIIFWHLRDVRMNGQGNLACCTPWGHKEWDTTEPLNWIELRMNGFINLNWTPNIELPILNLFRVHCRKYDSFSSLIKNFFHSINTVLEQKSCFCVTVS